jgi:hypothetical protein
VNLKEPHPIRGQYMKLTIIGSLLGLVVLTCLGCQVFGIEEAGWSNGIPTHITGSRQETDAFKEKLSGWLKDNGFVPTQDPGGMRSWSGLHGLGEINKWYKGRYKDSPPILLRVAIIPTSHSVETKFNFEHSWSVRGTESYIKTMSSLSDEFGRKFNAWCKSTKTPEKPDGG